MKKKRKICSVTTIAATTETFVLEAAKALHNLGWEVVLVCRMDESLKSKIPFGIRYYDIPMERSYNILAALKSFYLLCKIFRKERFTVLQYATTHAAFYSSLAGWFSRVPVRIYMQWGMFNFWDMGLKGKFFKLIEWITCKMSTHIRPVSNKNMEVAIRERLFKSKKGLVLGYGGTIGIDLNKYKIERKPTWRERIRSKYKIEEGQYVFGFIGRICEDKGCNELLAAFQQLQEQSEVTLFLIGPHDGQLDLALETWAKQAKNVIFAGSIKHDLMPEYLAAIDVLVHPTYREGFGMVLQEAMAMEIGIITTDIPGPSEVIENGISGELIPPKNMESLLKVMHKFANDRMISIEYGKHGRKRVESCFERKKMIDNICQDREFLLLNLD